MRFAVGERLKTFLYPYRFDPGTAQIFSKKDLTSERKSIRVVVEAVGK